MANRVRKFRPANWLRPAKDAPQDGTRGRKRIVGRGRYDATDQHSPFLKILLPPTL